MSFSVRLNSTYEAKGWSINNSASQNPKSLLSILDKSWSVFIKCLLQSVESGNTAADQMAALLGPDQMAALLGPSWKSRQPRMCQYCQRMFSNKFNLKQVKHNNEILLNLSSEWNLVKFTLSFSAYFEYAHSRKRASVWDLPEEGKK